MKYNIYGIIITIMKVMWMAVMWDSKWIMKYISLTTLFAVFYFIEENNIFFSQWKSSNRFK